MSRITTLGFVVSIAIVVSACGLNNVRQLPNVQAPDSGRATVIYGLAVDAPWRFPMFGMELDEYDMKRQNISGSCLRFNRMEASVSSVVGKTVYFEFDVRPGYYIYSRFNGAQFLDASLASRAFKVPEGAIVYVGDFVLGADGKVEFRLDRQSIRQALAGQSDLMDKVEVAESVEVKEPRPFLCTP